MIDDTRFNKIPPFVRRTIDIPDMSVVRTVAPTDEEIFDAVMAGINNRPCILDRDVNGVPKGDDEYMVASYPERTKIAHYLLPAIRELVTGHTVDEFDFLCGGTCGNEECNR